MASRKPPIGRVAFQGFNRYGLCQVRVDGFWGIPDRTLQIERGLMKQQFALVLVLFAALGVACGCGSPNKVNSSVTPSTSSPAKVNGQPTTTASGLQYWDTVVGTGATAIPGNSVKVHYTGFLTTGQKFDSSRDRGEAFSFPLGAGQVIKGWDEGVAGMQVGGQRQLRIPPELGYGATGAGGAIPPNATLIFDVELLEVGK
jgi:FKBP-type peptidyl-prolyl cis-trans isomerase